MTSLKTTVAKLSPIGLISKFKEWRTTCRKERIEKYQEMDLKRTTEEAEARKWETQALAYAQSGDWKNAQGTVFNAEFSWRNAWENINPLTPNARETRRRYENNIFRCDARGREYDDNLRRQESEQKQRAASA